MRLSHSELQITVEYLAIATTSPHVSNAQFLTMVDRYLKQRSSAAEPIVKFQWKSLGEFGKTYEPLRAGGEGVVEYEHDR